MTKYRLYALIHGQIIPVGKIGNCEIKYISSEEQICREFTPLQGVFSEKDIYYTSYATVLPYFDPMKLYTNYVIVHEIKESNVLQAIGGAIKEFEKVCATLFLSNALDSKSENNAP